MALKHSTGLRNTKLTTGFKSAFDVDGAIDFYSGAVPAAGDDAANGTKLATVTLSAVSFGAAASGAVTAAAITSNINIGFSGTPLSFVMYKTSQTATNLAALVADRRLWGTVTINGGGGDITFDSVTWLAGGTVAMSAFTYNESP